MLKNYYKTAFATVVLVLSGFAAKAQMEYVSSALEVINNNYVSDLEVTVSDLNKCLEDPTTSNEPKMWYARARVFQMVATNEDTAINNIEPNAPYLSLEAYIKYFKNPSNRSRYTLAAQDNLVYSR